MSTFTKAKSTIAIIVPVYNEIHILEDRLQSLIALRPNELIVVDGGSSDGSWDVLQRMPVVSLRSAKGRANQMNAGAKLAQSDILVFLHCDVRLPLNALNTVRKRMAEGTYRSGRFRLKLDHNSWLNSVHTWATRFHWFSFGDQCFFMKRTAFEAVGGFNPQAYFEDVEMYRKMRAFGPVSIERNHFVEASSRRYKKVGALRQRSINSLLLIMGIFNIDPRPIMKHIYKDIR